MASSMGNGTAASLAAQTRPFLAVAIGGLIVGVLDLAYAIIVYSPQKPVLVLQTIASGVLGERSYSGHSRGLYQTPVAA
jgi:type IV secretory pathway VirB6-like protein